jgi:DNA-binding CsgD family transcriptional regulator
MIQRLKKDDSKVGDLGALVHATRTSADPHRPVDAVQHQRRMVAELCKMLGGTRADHTVPATAAPHAPPPPPPPVVDTSDLAPRLRQTLERLLAGDSEKQVAHTLGLSPHTVHVYVKSLYRRFNVNSRGEFLALFIRHAT